MDAALLIHEGRLLYRERGLHLVVDLGDWWQAEEGLPLPLGVNVIRRGLGAARVARRCRRVLRASIAWALAHRDADHRAIAAEDRGDKALSDQALIDHYLNLYANARYGRDGRRREARDRRAVRAGARGRPAVGRRRRRLGALSAPRVSVRRGRRTNDHTRRQAARDAASWWARHSWCPRGPTRFAMPSTAVTASMPAAAAARATANASRFSSAAPVACARWRPSVAERVTAIGQATPSNGTGLFAARPQAASAALSVADVGARVASGSGR